MKSMIIKTVDVLAYIAFFAVALVALGVMFTKGFLVGLAVAVIGWVVCCLVFGAWFLLSNINDNLQKLAERK